MYQAKLTVNGVQYYAIGKTRKEAHRNVTRQIERSHSAGFAIVTRRYVRGGDV